MRVGMCQTYARTDRRTGARMGLLGDGVIAAIDVLGWTATTGL